MSVSTINVGDKTIIMVDCSEKSLAQIEDMKATLENAKLLVRSQSEKSVYIITNVTNSKFNPEIVKAFNDFAVNNSKYVLASVIVGINDTTKVIFKTIQNLHDRKFILTDTVDEAVTYLSSL